MTSSTRSSAICFICGLEQNTCKCFKKESSAHTPELSEKHLESSLRAWKIYKGDAGMNVIDSILGENVLDELFRIAQAPLAENEKLKDDVKNLVKSNAELADEDYKLREEIEKLKESNAELLEACESALREDKHFLSNCAQAISNSKT